MAPHDETGAEQNVGYRSIGRIRKAFLYSMEGLRHAATKEAAFQQELIVLAALSVLCLALPFGAYLKIQLLIAHIAILVVELLNSAIEAVADKVSLEFDDLIKQAKDTASAAVFLIFVAAFLLWSYALYTLI